MRKKVYNQFRIKGIEKDEIHLEELVEIVEKVFNVVERRGGSFIVMDKGRIPAAIWELIIEERGGTFDLYLENTKEILLERHSLFSGPRILMKKVAKEIDERILERRRAMNIERQAREADIKLREGTEGAGGKEKLIEGESRE